MTKVVDNIAVSQPATTGSPNLNRRQRQRSKLGSLDLEQQLTLFGRWTDDPVWVPPKDESTDLARSMLNRFCPFASREKCWSALSNEHRDRFTQVREIELPRASIRLPRGRLFVTVTERKDFERIEEAIPRSVQMRLDEFLQDKGRRRGVKVYYLKPLCVEVDNRLIFTTREQVNSAIAEVQGEVFSEYRRLYLRDRLRRYTFGAINTGLFVPRAWMNSTLKRKRREIEDYHQKLEFERRFRALMATRMHQFLRTDGCTFDEMLSLSDAPSRESVIEHYVQEKELSETDHKMFLIASAISLPWFAVLSLGIANLAAASAAVTVPIMVCDPAFVAEMPDRRGQLLKIGHFDEVDGVIHVEI